MKTNQLATKFFFLSFLMLFLFSQTLVASASEVNIRVTVQEAKIRFDASSESDVVSAAKNGEILAAEEKLGEWYKVTYTSKESGFTLTGYVHESEIQILGQDPAVQSAPQADIQPESVMLAPSSFRQNESGSVICSTLDFRYEYEIIGVIFHYQEFGALTLRDPLLSAVNTGLKKFKEKAAKMGGDAVIGLRFLFSNRTQKDEGRVLVYGTVIRFR